MNYFFLIVVNIKCYGLSIKNSFVSVSVYSIAKTTGNLSKNCSLVKGMGCHVISTTPFFFLVKFHHLGATNWNTFWNMASFSLTHLNLKVWILTLRCQKYHGVPNFFQINSFFLNICFWFLLYRIGQCSPIYLFCLIIP